MYSQAIIHFEMLSWKCTVNLSLILWLPVENVQWIFLSWPASSRPYPGAGHDRDLDPKLQTYHVGVHLKALDEKIKNTDAPLKYF